MVGEKIRAYREFRGLNQIQLADLSGINVGTIRKYELGIRNPKPDQLEKIASALGLNVSVFLDFNIETVGDVLSLLFAIDDSPASLHMLTANSVNIAIPVIFNIIFKNCWFIAVLLDIDCIRFIISLNLLNINHIIIIPAVIDIYIANSGLYCFTIIMIINDIIPIPTIFIISSICFLLLLFSFVQVDF